MIVWTLLRRSDPEPLEIASAFVAIVWGLSLAAWGSWSAASSQILSQHVLSAELWGEPWRQGASMLIAGLLQLAGVEKQCAPVVRARHSVVVLLLWSVVAASFAQSAWVSGQVGTGLGVYCMFVACCMWITYRHWLEVQIARTFHV